MMSARKKPDASRAFPFQVVSIQLGRTVGKDMEEQMNQKNDKQVHQKILRRFAPLGW
jgi:hypothetical protein